VDDWDGARVRRTIRDIRVNEYVMTQQDFAEHLEVSVGALIGWENGRESPRISTRQKVAAKLHMRPRDIQWDVPMRPRRRKVQRKRDADPSDSHAHEQSKARRRAG
jgi:DNA-binding XRE family transcriptional regulator